jgi:hypothetical protein
MADVDEGLIKTVHEPAVHLPPAKKPIGQRSGNCAVSWTAPRLFRKAPVPATPGSPNRQTPNQGESVTKRKRGRPFQYKSVVSKNFIGLI